MTTIFCDGKQLIADQQTSGIHTSRRSIGGKLVMTRYPFKTKDSIKIHQPPNLWFKNRQVLAIAFSGPVPKINPMVELLCKKPRVVAGENITGEKPDVRSIMEILSHFPQLKTESMTGLGLCDDGTMIRISVPAYTGDMAGPPITVVEHKSGVIVCGSGKQFYDSSKKHFVSTPETIDAFLYTVHQDPKSSYDHSIFTLETKKLATSICPTKEEVSASIDRFMACCDFKKANKEGFLTREVDGI